MTNIFAFSNTAPLDSVIICCTTVTTTFNILSRDILFIFGARTDWPTLCCSCWGEAAGTLYSIVSGPATWCVRGCCCSSVLPRMTPNYFYLSLYKVGSDLTENMCQVPECVFISPLPCTKLRADNIENTSSNTFYIVAWAYFGRCLELCLHVTIYKQLMCDSFTTVEAASITQTGGQSAESLKNTNGLIYL
jgi:hypothetical protein